MTRIAPLPRVVAACALTLLGLGVAAAPAHADDPFRLADRVEDRTTDAVLAGSEDDILAAADELAAGSDLDLFVVYVDSFDGTPSQDWADETAVLSDLGVNDILLAVAVEDRSYAYSVDGDNPLSDAQLANVAADIEDELRVDDWAGAAVAAAEGYLEEATGGGGGVPVVPILIGAGVVGGGIFLLTRSSRKKKQQTGAAPSTGARGQAGPRPDSLEAQLAALSTEDLGKRAGAALVSLDDDVRSSEQELGFAVAQFGLQATRGFKDVLESVRKQLGEAFALQQRLDDSTPESEPEKRQLLTRIILLCQQGDDALDDQADAFAELRQMQDRAPQLLGEIEQRADEIGARIPAAEQALTQLHATYPQSALVSISRAPVQARQLLDAAREAVRQGRARVDAGDRGTAVAFVRTAEDALDQAVTLVDSVASAGQDLEQATAKLDGAVASITADLSDVARLAPGDDAVAPLAARAQAAVAQAQEAKRGGDPLAALAEITAAEQALDAALASRRQAEEVSTRAAQQLTTGLSRTEQLIRSANTYIETHRGAVGSTARTRLATAIEYHQRATALAKENPVEALQLTTSAWHAAQAAQDLAASDVAQWERTRVGPGSFGGGSYGRGGGIDMGSLILGGILGEVFDNDDRGWGGSWGGGSSWGGGYGGSSRNRSRSRSSYRSSGSSRRSSGRSFGGGGRRSSGRSSGGRRGGGGRF